MSPYRRRVGGARSPQSGIQPVLFANKAQERKARDAAAAAALAKENKKSRSTTHLEYPAPGSKTPQPTGLAKGIKHVTDDVVVVLRGVQGLDRVQLGRRVLQELASSEQYSARFDPYATIGGEGVVRLYANGEGKALLDLMGYPKGSGAARTAGVSLPGRFNRPIYEAPPSMVHLEEFSAGEELKDKIGDYWASRGSRTPPHVMDQDDRVFSWDVRQSIDKNADPTKAKPPHPPPGMGSVHTASPATNPKASDKKEKQVIDLTGKPVTPRQTNKDYGKRTVVQPAQNAESGLATVGSGVIEEDYDARKPGNMYPTPPSDITPPQTQNPQTRSKVQLDYNDLMAEAQKKVDDMSGRKRRNSKTHARGIISARETDDRESNESESEDDDDGADQADSATPPGLSSILAQVNASRGNAPRGNVKSPRTPARSQPPAKQTRHSSNPTVPVTPGAPTLNSLLAKARQRNNTPGDNGAPRSGRKVAFDLSGKGSGVGHPLDFTNMGKTAITGPAHTAAYEESSESSWSNESDYYSHSDLYEGYVPKRERRKQARRQAKRPQPLDFNE